MFPVSIDTCNVYCLSFFLERNSVREIDSWCNQFKEKWRHSQQRSGKLKLFIPAAFNLLLFSQRNRYKLFEITSNISQQMHIYKFHFKHFKTHKKYSMFRSFQIIIREFRRSLLKLLHIHDLVCFCKKRYCGSISCCVGICCRECSWLVVRRMLRSEGLVSVVAAYHVV